MTAISYRLQRHSSHVSTFYLHKQYCSASKVPQMSSNLDAIHACTEKGPNIYKT